MRTTLDIADDVLFAAKEIARRDKKSLGQVVSELARTAFQTPSANHTSPSQHAAREALPQYGIKPLPARGVVVTNAEIDQLRDIEGI